ncbi:phosphoribosyltransferase family protein [Corynebacterium sp. Z-1]|uniref:ComF family protein n=1 Tax=Corynebacterium sp. Z-1 TaxID=3074378 RepID=UPI0028833612|nr:phosphoribosyltransferase family protein [Corynebacterium sp. Z-1]WNI13792.1 phosphoribosyltransferase family protein [Corynebacterium sp. Z-1]
MFELVLPRRCAGCAAAGQVLCEKCQHALAALPYRVSTGVDTLAPVFVLGPYAGAHRGIVLSMKKRANLAVRRHAGMLLDAALTHLEARGEIPEGAVLVPAPTRRAAARARGGDPVEALCRASGRPTAAVLSLARAARDQSELSAAQRRANLAGQVRCAAVPAGVVIVVDDVVTTGSTLHASVATLLARGADVRACVALCGA